MATLSGNFQLDDLTPGGGFVNAPVRPVNFPTAFAVAGVRNVIPQSATGSNLASFNEGFPPITMRPIAAGGQPPAGKDFNGILFDVTSHVAFLDAGGQYRFDATLAAQIGGYPAGAVLQSNDGLRSYVSVVNNNSTDFNSGGAGIGSTWMPWAGASHGVTPVSSTGGTVTLTAAQAAADFIRVTGVLASDLTVNVPAAVGAWNVINATTGAHTVTIAATGGTGVPVSQGSASAVICDGTNVLYMETDGVTQVLTDSSKRKATTEFVQQLLASLVPPTGKWKNLDIVTATGNYTGRAGVSVLRAYAFGQGGAGNTSGAGGGGGGCAYGEITITAAQVIACTLNSTNTLFGTYLTANAGVTPGSTTGGVGGTASISGAVTNGGASTGGVGGNGVAAGGAGGGGASGSPLGTGGAGATGSNGAQGSGGGGGGWGGAGGAGQAASGAGGGGGGGVGAGGVASTGNLPGWGGGSLAGGISRDAVTMLTDPLLAPCNAPIPPILSISSGNISYTANGGPGVGGSGGAVFVGGAGGQGGGGGGGYAGTGSGATSGGNGGLGGGGGGAGTGANGGAGGYGGGGGGSVGGLAGAAGAPLILIFY